MKKYTLLYLFVPVLLLIFAIAVISEEIFKGFNPQRHSIVEFIDTVLFFLIFLRANAIGTRENDIRYIVIAAGFLTSGLFTIYHIILGTHEFPNDVFTGENLNEQLYFIFHRWLYIFAVFIAPLLKPLKTNNIKEFKFKLYSIVLAAIISMLVLFLIIENLFFPISNYLILNNLVIVIELSLYILSIFIYADKLTRSRNKRANILIMGLVISGISQMGFYFQNLSVIQGITYHLISVFGSVFIFAGMSEKLFDKRINYTYFLRSKNAIYYSIFYTAAYFIWVLIASYILNLGYSSIYLYTSMLLLALGVLAIYKISRRIASPVSRLHFNIDNLVNTISNKSASKNHILHPIEIVSEDEIGEISTKINTIFDSYNNTLQEYEKKSNNHKFLKEISDHIRLTADLPDILQKISNKIGAYFDSERTAILIIDGRKVSKSFNEHINFFEYRKKSSIPSIKGLDYLAPYTEAFDNWMKYKKTVVVNDSRENIFSEEINDFYKLSGIRSHISVVLECKDNFYGILRIGELNQPREWTESEIQLCKELSNIINHGLYQHQLYQEAENKAFKEVQIKKILDILRKNLEIDKLLKSLCQDIRKLFDVDRVIFAQYTPEVTGKISIKAECRLNDQIPALNKLPISDDTKQYFAYLMSSEKPIIINNIEEYDFPSFVKEDMRTQQTKSGMYFPIQHEGHFWGIIILHQTQNIREWREDEISLLQTIVGEIYSAINLSQLYTDLQQKAKKEDLISKIAGELLTTRNLQNILSYISQELTDLFQVDRISMVNYPEKSDFSSWDVVNEHKATPEIKGIYDIDYPGSVKKYIGNMLIKEGKDLITDSIQESDWPDYVKDTYSEMNVKSLAIVPVQRGQEKWGILALSYVNNYKTWSDEEIRLLHSIADYIYIAVKEAQLYEELRKKAERESLLRNIISTIRTSLDINETLATICDEIGRAFNVQRATIVEFDKTNYENFTTRREYKAREDVKGLRDVPYNTKAGAYIAGVVLDQDKNLVIDNIPESDTPDYYKKSYELLGVKSALSVAVKQADDKWGIIYLSETDHYRHWTEDEIKLMETISDQVYIAIKQAELYSTTKQQAEREALLRKIVTVIRSTLDINEIKKNIVTEIGKALNADRVFIVEFDPNTNTPQVLDKYSEYLSSQEYSSFVGFDFSSPEVEFFTDIHKQTKPIIVEDVNKYIQENNLEDTKVGDWLIKTGLKTGIATTISYQDRVLGALAIHYIRHPVAISDEQMEFLSALGDQTGIALYQSRLYSATKKQAEREALLRRIITIIRSTLDVNQIKSSIVTEIGKVFGADRCYIYEVGVKGNIDSEYLSSSDLVSFIGMDVEHDETLKSLRDMNIKEGIELIILDAEEYINSHGLQGSPLAKHIESFNIKSGIGIPILDTGQVLGIFIMHFTKNKYFFTGQDLEFLRVLTNQTGIALYQSKLYDSVSYNANKERVLREIISDIKLTQEPQEIYEYLIRKLAEIFNADRTMFIELPSYRYERPRIRYEFIKKADLLSLKDVALPEACQGIFYDLANKLNVININNTSEFHKDNEESQSFFNKYGIKSMIFAPLAMYNHEITLLGGFSICIKHPRNWTDKEVDLLKSIMDPVGIFIGEITKRSEIEELRNIFMLTLAHDLQVPLIGEHKALEFVISRPDDTSIGKMKGIINDTIKSNENLTGLLTRLLSVYNYESGRKTLSIENHNISSIINDAVNSLRNQADSKSLRIEVKIKENIPNVQMDRAEIFQVIFNLLENAILYIQENGEIVISSYQQENNLIICIKDNGPGIAPAVRERLFERYAMAQAIERKVGSGLGLYLSKLIVEAHKGRIWYTTEIGTGSTFCFSLPIEK